MSFPSLPLLLLLLRLPRSTYVELRIQTLTRLRSDSEQHHSRLEEGLSGATEHILLRNYLCATASV